MKTLETKRLLLRPWDIEDVNILYEYAKDFRVGPPCGWLPHKNIEYSALILKNVLSKPYTYAITLKETNQIIGNISIMLKESSNFAQSEDEVEIGYWLGVPFWHCGYMSEAVEKVIQFAFEEMQIKRIWCGAFEGNNASLKVQEKNGFIYKQTIYQMFVSSLNEYKDLHVSLLTREQWKKHKEEKEYESEK